ncbi:MAG: hypothetical protein L3J91_05665 [Thermoplasmata archaeon]|nr:hypothetical protein [Thermoplasmata archaeon]
MSDLAATVGAGLLTRFRAAGAELTWRDAAPPKVSRRRAPPPERVRIAHLHDEEARVAEHIDGTILVDAGPVGALVLLLEIDRRGAPAQLEALEAAAAPGFGQGAIRAYWGTDGPNPTTALPMADLVSLARYALV